MSLVQIGDCVKRIAHHQASAWAVFFYTKRDTFESYEGFKVVAVQENTRSGETKIRIEGSDRWWIAANFAVVSPIRGKTADLIIADDLQPQRTIMDKTAPAATYASHAAYAASIKHTEEQLADLRKQQAEAEAVAAKAAAEQAERAALTERLSFDRDLANATAILLDSVKTLRLGKLGVGAQSALARFIKELQPLALSYGVRIVKVGDKSTATLVLV